jgi:BTB/POZ domain
MKVVSHAHRGVLAQSPVLAALLEYRIDNGQALHIDLPRQEPVVFRLMLQYLYRQRLPVAASATHARLLEMLDGYILACQLELDKLQDRILCSLTQNEQGFRIEEVLYAVWNVYRVDQARQPLRDFVKSALLRGIEEEGFKGPNFIGHAIRILVRHGTAIAEDVAEVLTQNHTRKCKSNGCAEDLELQLEEQKRQNAELQVELEDWKTKTKAAESRSESLNKTSEAAHEQAKLQFDAMEGRALAAEKGLEFL